MSMENVDFTKLEVDKENEVVKYNDKIHKYWTKDENLNCISVTTLLHKFQNFDEDFWSQYKALEALTGDKFKDIKGNLVKSKFFNIDYTKVFGISEKDFNSKREEILKQWADKRDASCVRGTAIHLEHEKQHLAGKTKELKGLGLKQTNFGLNTTNKIKPGEQAVYPELLLSRISADKKLRVAGQADLVIIDGFDVYVLDYKSNEKMTMKGFYDQRTRSKSTLKYPLNNIEDSNFWHYTIQLSTYAWMIQMIDPRFVIKKLMLIHYDHDGGKTDYECEYRKDDVVRMLAFHKKQIMNEEFKNSREKIKH